MSTSNSEPLTTDQQSESSPMDAETLTALRGSIAKWEAIVARTGKDEGTSNCPLCVKFYNPRGHRERYEENDGPNHCAGCPVAEATGQDYCEGSPYERYLQPAYPHSVAVEELAFLKSLLPPGVES